MDPKIKYYKQLQKRRLQQIALTPDPIQELPIRLYWGAEAIAVRLGHRPGSKGKLKQWVARYGVPAYLRRKPGRYCVITWYSSESLIVIWELQRVAHYRNWLDSQGANSKASREASQW